MAGSDHTGTDSAAATRLTEAVEAANTLLYHAICSGQDLPNTVRDPIIRARAILERDGALTEDLEGQFLDAYAKLSLRVAPVTAATLAATSRNRGRPTWLGRLVGRRPVSDAQRLASYFGLLAIALIAAIAFGEWTHTFIGSIAAAEKQFAKNSQEFREVEGRVRSIEDQIAMLAPGAGSSADTASTSAVREALKAQKSEMEAKIWALRYANGELDDAIQKGHETLERMLFLDREKVRHVIAPIGVILGTFLLPVLYGALGTCAFAMRSLFREMVDRTFDARRTGEFTVRIFLGMLSGLTLQWLVVRADGTVAAGVTPAVLAFLGGYSVEMLFTAIDRLVNLVAGRVRGAHRSQAAVRPARKPGLVQASNGKRSRLREAAANGATNGTAPTPRAAVVTELSALRSESG